MSQIKEERPKDISKACRVLKTSRSSLSYCSIKNDEDIKKRLTQLSRSHPTEGFWKFFNRLRNLGETVNHKRLHRVYKQMGLSIRRKVKRRLPARIKEHLDVPESFTHTWSIDFMTDVLEGGTRFRTFNVIDDYNREVLFIEVDYSLKSSRVIWVLRHVVSKYGKPKKIRMDNGPEFIAAFTKSWSESLQIDFKYIQPGKPTQNAYVERFNRSYRTGVLDALIFKNINEVREATDDWLYDYNHMRPHDSLGGISPVNYRDQKVESLEKQNI